MRWTAVARIGVAGLVAVAAADAARAADAVRPTLPPLPPVVAVAPAFSWAGAYVGIHGGYSWGRSDGNYDNPLAAAAAGPLIVDPQGWYSGGQLGVNFATPRQWVLGVEADASWGDIAGTIPDILGDLHDPPGPYTITGKTDYLGTVRARLGYAMGRVLPYATGGFAWAHSTVSSTDGPVSDSATLTGWTAGGGVEMAASDRVSLKIEYLYAAFGNHTWFSGQAFSSTAKSSSNSVRVGANFRFR